VLRFVTDIEIKLPEAEPADYLSWMAFWREVEQRVGASPALETMASEESAPFIRDDIARFLSDNIVGAIATQAGEAKQRGDELVTPMLRGNVEIVPRALHDVALRMRWLTDERCRAMGIEPLEPHLVALRLRVLETVLDQLGSVDRTT
jgi:hypothetical protein